MLTPFFLYAIISCHRKYIYVGISSNLKDRLRRHNSGWEKTTKPYRPFLLLYFEVLNGIPQARQREKYLKGRSGKRYLYHIAAQKKEYLVSAGLSSWLGESEPEM